jgi:hypothetical protein
MQPFSIGMLRLVTWTFFAGGVHAPMEWTRDGQWLALTTVEVLGETVTRGWIFEAGGEAGGRSLVAEGDSPIRRLEPRGFRIWAVERGRGAGVLVAESNTPLSSPAWGPDGHRLAYLRLAPASGEPGDSERSRMEVIVQDALDRRRVVAVADQRWSPRNWWDFVNLRVAWSPDGHTLAVPRPDATGAMLVLRIEDGKVVRTLERGWAPRWSPDGQKLAYLRRSEGSPGRWSLEVIGQDMGPSRSLLELTDVSAAPAWDADGQSVLIAGSRIQPRVVPRGRDVELLRVILENGRPLRLLPLGTLPLDQPAPGGLPGEAGRLSAAAGSRVAIDFDEQQEQCVYWLDIEGQPPVVVFGNIRRPITYKRFHPLDLSLKLGALAMAPDGQAVAVRVESPVGSGPALVCELGSEAVTPLAPDRASRMEWLATLTATARRLLDNVPAEGGGAGLRLRPTILPFPGEISAQEGLSLRLRRLGRVGMAVLEAAEGGASVAGSPPGEPGWEEYRLFFKVLRGDFRGAESEIASLELDTRDPDRRLRLLGLRAQVLAGQGQRHRARLIVEYLKRQVGTTTSLIEETPLGVVLTTQPDSTRLWVDQLSEWVEKGSEAVTGPLVPSGSLELEEGEGSRLIEPLPGNLGGPPRAAGVGRPRVIPVIQ